jgi:pyruvate kinase
MLDTVGPELQVVNKGENAISLEENASVVLTPDEGQEATSDLLPINFGGLAKARALLISSHTVY